jgi:hypothetical protein
MAGESKTSRRRIQTKETAARALELRKAGATYEQIAQQLGYAHKGKAYEAVTAAMREVTREGAEEVLNLELARLDALTVALWPKARQGSGPAVDRVLKVMERRAKLLGLDYNEARMADVAEREVALAEAQGALVAAVIERILARLGLTEEQEALVGVVVPSELRAVTGGGGS